MDPAAVLTILGTTSLVLITAGRVLTTWHLPITETRIPTAWCQGCQRVRRLTTMAWTDVGTYRCPNCYPRRTP